LHGTTLHGKQSRDPQRQLEPLTYFSRSGPIGQLFNYITSTKQSPEPKSLQVYNSTEKSSASFRVAVLGLGVGTLASYAQSGQEWTFYEIDPAVVKIASNPQYFSFLSNAPTKSQIILGDGRLQLAKVADNTYDLLIMDAFSSDAIPVHLVTLEAIELYLKKLKNNGIIAINISNRFVDLEPVIVNLAHKLGLVEYSQIDRSITELEKDEGKTASHWIVLTRDQISLGNLPQDPRWRRGTPQARTPLWTDDFSDIWQVLRFQNNPRKINS
jgi:spermidine synthase